MTGRKKRVLIVCGTAIATSTVVAHKIGEFLKKKGIEAEVRQAKVMEMRSMLDGVDLVVSTTIMPTKVPVPVVNGIAFMTGVNLDATLDEIARILGEEVK